MNEVSIKALLRYSNRLCQTALSCLSCTADIKVHQQPLPCSVLFYRVEQVSGSQCDQDLFGIGDLDTQNQAIESGSKISSVGRSAGLRADRKANDTYYHDLTWQDKPCARHT